MALKLSLKPGEKMIIGGAVVKNGDAKAELFIENQVPLLREKDIMRRKGCQDSRPKNLFHHSADVHRSGKPDQSSQYLLELGQGNYPGRPFDNTPGGPNQRKDRWKQLLPGSETCPQTD